MTKYIINAIEIYMQTRLTNTGRQFGRRPRAIGLTVAVGPADQIEARRARISDAAAEGVAVAFVAPVGDVSGNPARSSCSIQNTISRYL